MLNLSAQSAFRRARDQVGIAVTLQRISGQAPNAVAVSAQVTAIVRDYQSDSGQASRDDYGLSRPGAITQGDREVIIIEGDLAAAYYPLPVVKHDKVLLPTGDVLDVTEVDANKMALAGVIWLKAAGVQ
jgi:hypothetical protein